MARARGSVGDSPDTRFHSCTLARSQALARGLAPNSRISNSRHVLRRRLPPSRRRNKNRGLCKGRSRHFLGVEHESNRVGPHTSLQNTKMGVTNESNRDMRSCSVGISKDLHLESIPHMARSVAADSAAVQTPPV
jgi:hypothetical protein